MTKGQGLQTRATAASQNDPLQDSGSCVQKNNRPGVRLRNGRVRILAFHNRFPLFKCIRINEPARQSGACGEEKLLHLRFQEFARLGVDG